VEFQQDVLIHLLLYVYDPAIPKNTNKRQFHGVHVGGAKALSNNFFIQVTNQDFVYDYFYSLSAADYKAPGCSFEGGSIVRQKSIAFGLRVYFSE
jgi:hypothetical protein